MAERDEPASVPEKRPGMTVAPSPLNGVKLELGLVLVVGILYLFLTARVAFWVAVGIPVSFMATLAILYAAGDSINMISLFALIMALGIIVDDAIVVGEDALAHYQAGEPPLLAAEGGARRMLAPVMASSLTARKAPWLAAT